MAEETREDWLTDAYDYERPRRGQFREGVVLRVEDDGAIIDLGLKREGLVSRRDVERLGPEVWAQLEPGQEVLTCVVRPQDREGNLILSMYRARLEKEWRKAEQLLENGELCECTVTGYNRGGLKVQFDGLNGFVPGSHLWALDGRRLSSDQREEKFKAYVGQELPMKVIEVERQRNRLVLSERLARRQLRRECRQRLLEELLEGQVVQGTVSRLCDFGAFVDLGGTDGLIHISELSWQRVRHPREVVQVGEEIQVYVLRLDYQRNRIGLSLKRVQPDPWNLVESTYTEDQLVPGIVTGVKDFGAFVALDVGVEGLIHVSELSDPPPQHPQAVVKRGDELLVRILQIDLSRRRIGLSLKRVSPEEREEYLGGAEVASDGAAATDDATPTERAPAEDGPALEGEATPALSTSM